MDPIDPVEVAARIAAQQGALAPQPQPSLPRSLPRELVAMIWQLMGSMYGHKWVSSYGGDVVDPDRVWAAALYGLDEAAIRKGMRACVDQGLAWPPSAPEFRVLCLGEPEAWQHKTAAYRQFPSASALPDKTGEERRDAVARETICRLRGTFRPPPPDELTAGDAG